MKKEMDYMESSSDANAQAAYVTNAAAVDTSIYQSGSGESTYMVLGDNAGTEYRAAQKIVLTETQTIAGFKYKLGASNGTPSGNHTIRIETNSTTVPSGTLADANFSKVITPTASAENTATFATPTALAAGTYWVVLNCDNQTTSNYWKVLRGTPYVQLAATSTNGTWTSLAEVHGSAFHALYYRTYSLQSYSESTIKTQGSYALKAVAAQTTSLNKTLTKTFASPLDLSGINTLKLDMRSTRTGANVKLGLHDTGGTTTELTPTINSADTYETKTWDISGVSDANKNAIDTFIVTVTNADSANDIYLDNFFGILYRQMVFISD